MASENFINAESRILEISAVFSEQIAIVNKLVTAVKSLDTAYRTPSAYLNAQRELADVVLANEKAYQELQKSVQAAEKAKQAAARATLAELQAEKESERVKQQANNTKRSAIRLELDEQRAKEATTRATRGQKDAYGALNAEMNTLFREAANLAVEMYILKEAGEANTEQYRLLGQEFEDVAARQRKLDGALKQIDSSLGRNQRRVGDYASGFNPLNAAVGQIAREIPNFAQSVQIGILSITNNIGALQDAIGGIVAQNKELIKQGQPVKSVFSQIAGSVLSFNTLLYVGVAALSAYGSEISTWIESLFAADSAMDKIVENQEKLNASRVTGLKNTVEEKIQLKENLAIARDTALTTTEREIALKKLREQYPLYFKELTNQQIYAGETAEAEREITKALNERANANDATKIIAENKKRIIDIREQIRLNNVEIGQNKQIIDQNTDKLGSGREGSDAIYLERVNAANKAINNTQKENITLRKELEKLNEQNVDKEGEILQSRKNSIGLDFQEEKTRKKREKQNKDNIDYEASLYELRVLSSEQLIAYEEKIMNDTEVNYSKRLAAAEEYYMEQANLLSIQEAQERSAENFRYTQLKAEYTAAIKEGTATNAQLEQIELQHTYNLDKINADYRGRNFDLTVESAKKLKDVLAGIELQANNNQIDTEALEQYYALQQELSATNVNTSYEQFRDLEKRKEALETNTAKKRNILQVEETERQIAQLKASQKISDTEEDRNNQNQKLNELNGKLVGLKRQQAELDDKAIEDAKQLSLELKRTTDQYLQGFSNGFLQDAGLDIFTDIFQKGEDGLTNFQRRMKGAGEDLTKQFQVSFTTITELAQQAFAFISQASQTRFRLEYEGLERQKDSQLRFAGESQSAQEEITRQYEEKRRDIRNRELRAQKDQATFNAIINTAQAVVAALPNIPLSVTIGAIGAAQIAFIRAQQIPAFAEGGITEKNGQILVNDAGGSNYKEVVMTPSGKVFMPQKRNTIMNMPKGTEIFKDYSTFDKRLNEMLTANNIAPGYNYSLPVLPSLQQSGSGNVSAAIKNGFAGLKQSIVNVSMDKRGWNMSIENGHNEQELRNNSLRCNGRRIR